jgi:hypothetical protein
MKCSVEGCNVEVRTKGFCGRHHHRWLRHGDPLGGRTQEGAPLKFLQSTFTHFEDDCIAWPFGRDGYRYGTIHWHGRTARPHRIVCERFNGKPPSPKHETAHTCGKGHLGCINGYHLRWATHAENQADTIIHGTSISGERNHMARLTTNDVLLIRSLACTKTHVAIARQFGVSSRSITDIVNRRSWRHV